MRLAKALPIGESEQRSTIFEFNDVISDEPVLRPCIAAPAAMLVDGLTLPACSG
jgi:hypothetical protein